jgi:hypothetical protein
MGSSNTAILRGAGIFESIDSGVTWTRITSTSTPDWYFVNRLVFQPGSPLVMLAATATGIWRSTDGGQNWSQRTTNAHARPRLPSVPIRCAPSPDATTAERSGRSTAASRGTPCRSRPLRRRVELAYARSSPTTVFATVSDTSQFIHVWRSLDGGQTWAQRSTTSIGTYSLYNNALWVDPTNANNLVYGGVQLYRSTDAGGTRTQFTNGSHPDYHVIVEHPGYNGNDQQAHLHGQRRRPAHDRRLAGRQLDGAEQRPRRDAVLRRRDEPGLRRD